MRRIGTTLLGGTFLLLSAPALAGSGETPEPDEPDWSLGLGVGISGAWLGASAGVGAGAGLGGLGGPFFYASAIERRVGHGTWLMLRANGSYSSLHDDSDNVSRSWTLGGTLGVRQVINPDDPFQVSFFGQIGPSFTGSRSPTMLDDGHTSVPATLVISSWDVHAAAGLALEQAFTEHLGMRLSLTLLSAGYAESHSSVENDSQEVANHASGFDASVGFSPQLDLRFAW